MRQVFVTYNSKDVVFYVTTKLITYLTHNSQVYLLIIAAIGTGSVGRLIYKYPYYPELSYLIYFALGQFAIEFQLLRLVIAISISSFSIDYIFNRQIRKFILVICLASLFHSSVLIMIIAYPISKMKIGLKQWGIILGFLVIAFAGKNYVYSVLSILFLNRDRYSYYIDGSYNTTTLSLTSFFIQLSIYTLSMVLIWRKKNDDLEIRTLLNLSVIAIAFMALVGIIGEFQRLGMLFGIYNIILLPRSIYESDIITERSKKPLSCLVGLIFIVYFVGFAIYGSGLDQYTFFWS